MLAFGFGLVGRNAGKRCRQDGFVHADDWNLAARVADAGDPVPRSVTIGSQAQFLIKRFDVLAIEGGINEKFAQVGIREGKSTNERVLIFHIAGRAGQRGEAGIPVYGEAVHVQFGFRTTEIAAGGSEQWWIYAHVEGAI